MASLSSSVVPTKSKFELEDSSLNVQIQDCRYFSSTWFTHKVIFLSNCDHWSEADVYLIGDIHNSKDSQRYNAKLISSIANRVLPLDTLMLMEEGTPSMRKIEDPNIIKNLKTISSLDPSIDCKIDIYGWDAKILESMGNSREESILISECLLEIEKKILINLNIIRRYCPVYFETNNSDLSSLPLETLRMVALCMQQYSTLQNQKRFWLNEEERGEATAESIKQTFPARTLSMVVTLRKIKNMLMKGIVRGKVVFVAGAEHLKTRGSRLGIQEYCLDSLYHELIHHKIAVLIPSKASNLR